MALPPELCCGLKAGSPHHVCLVFHQVAVQQHL